MNSTAEASDPSISVIVTANHLEEYLPQTLESVQQQSFNSWELLIVGASESSSVKALAKKDSRIRFVSRPQNTLQETEFSLGLSAAKGDYVAFLESGDFYLPDFLKKLYEHSQLLDHVDIAFSDFRYSGRQIDYPDAWSWHHLWRKKLNRKKKYQVRYIQFENSKSCIRHRTEQETWSSAISFYLLHGLSFNSCRKLYRREFLAGLEFPKSGLGELPFHWISCMQAKNLLFCNTAACQHDTRATGAHADSSSGSSGAEHRESPAILMQFQHVLDHLVQQDDLPKQNFYLLLWMRSLLATFCFGPRLPNRLQMRLQSLQDWQHFFQAIHLMLHHKMAQHKVLAKTLKPTYKLKFSDFRHLRLNLVEQIAWNLLLVSKPKAQCGKFTLCFLAFLYTPVTSYWLAVWDRVRLLSARLFF